MFLELFFQFLSERFRGKRFGNFVKRGKISRFTAEREQIDNAERVDDRNTGNLWLRTLKSSYIQNR